MSEQSHGGAGGDVGKSIPVAARSAGPALEFAGAAGGHAQLRAGLERRHGYLAVCEPSGGYPQALGRCRRQGRQRVSPATPGRARA